VARVEFVEVSKRYGEAGAVRNANLTVEDHEFVVLLGPSGCGKSTLLKMVAGLEDVTDGEIYIDGRLVNYVRPADRDVAMVFQNYALYPHMTVFDNIAFPLKMTGVAKSQIEERVKRAAASLGLEPYLQRRPEQLSGGQRQRVALGRAIVREPSVFLMDEPLSNLDAQLRVQTREELLKLHARLQRTTIYVTHDQVEAMTMGNRIVVMRGGEIQQVGKPQHVYDHPVNTFVAAFLGSPRINLLSGTFRVESGVGVFEASGLKIPLPARLTANYAGGEMALGIRPEDISIGGFETNGSADMVTIDATVALVEPVGSDLYVNTTAGETSWMARTDPRAPIERGQTIALKLNLANAKVFGPDGRNLNLPA
jgi:multiple sugar transport system ATP-binding protein